MKRKIFSILFALVLVLSFSLVAAVPVSAATAEHDSAVDLYKVTTEGAATWSSTWNDPSYTTISGALTYAATNAPGGSDHWRIEVDPATYKESLTIGGSNLANLVLVAVKDNTNIPNPDPSATVIEGTGDHTINVAGSDGLTIKGFTLTSSAASAVAIHTTATGATNLILKNIVAKDFVGYPSAGYGFYLMNLDGTKNLIQNCTTKDNEFQGIMIQDPASHAKVVIDSCTVTGNDLGGIFVSDINATGVTIKNCTLSENADATGAAPDGVSSIEIWDSTATANSIVTIEGNTIKDTGDDKPAIVVGLGPSHGVGTLTVKNNTFSGNADTFDFEVQPDKMLIAGNTYDLTIEATPARVVWDNQGETVDVAVKKAGSLYTAGIIQYAVWGITGGTAGILEIIASGSTTNGQFSFTETFDLVTDGSALLGEYFIVVRTGPDVFEALGEHNLGEAKCRLIDSWLTYETGPETTVTGISGTTYGDTLSVSGSTVDAQGEYNPASPVGKSITTEVNSGNIGHQVAYADGAELATTDPASNGNWSINVVLTDADKYLLRYKEAADMWSAARNGTYNYVIDSFVVSPQDVLTVTCSKATAISVIQEFTGAKLTAKKEGAAITSGDIRFKLSGVPAREYKVTGPAVIDKVVLSDGTEIGTIDAAVNGLAADGECAWYYDGVKTLSDTKIVTRSTATIATIYLAKAGCSSDAEVTFNALFTAPGTVTAEAQWEEITHYPITPLYPDETGSADVITVVAPERLNVLPDTTVLYVDSDKNGTQDTQTVTVSIINEDGQGLKTEANELPEADHAGIADAKEINSLEVTLQSSDTEFSYTDLTAEGIVETDEYTASPASGNNLSSAKLTVAADDSDFSDADVEEINAVKFTGLAVEQAGTLTLTVKATFQNGDSLTVEKTITATGESASVTPTSGVAGEVSDVEVTVTKEGTAINSRFVGLVPDTTGALSIDKDADGVYEAGEVYDQVWYNPATEELQKANGHKIVTAAAVTDGLYDFGDIKFLKVTKIDVKVCKVEIGGELTAFLEEQINVTGEAVYTLTPDVDSVVAGISNTVDLTVTEDGTPVTGAVLAELEGNIAVKQDTVTPAFSSSVVGDVIRLTGLYPEDVSASALALVEVSTKTDDGTKTGSVDIVAVEPSVALTIDGIAESKITRGFIEPVSIAITDPRDGSDIATADLKVAANNLKLELNSIGNVFSSEPEPSPHFADVGLLLNGTGAGDTSDSDTALNSATYDFDALAYSLDTGEVASITLSVCDDASTWIKVATISIEDATGTVAPAAVVIGVASHISMTDAVDAHGQPLADGNARLFLGTVLGSGTLDENGAITFVVTPTATGTILAQVEDDTDAWQTLGTVTVSTVEVRTLQSIEVTPATPAINVGGTQQFTATGTYNLAPLTEDITTEVTWASSNLSVATIDATGLATGEAEGTTNITATLGIIVSEPAVLTVSGVFDPMVYDENDDGVIDIGEVLTAISDYFAEEITIANVLEVITLYF